jgi:hypothetical protein
VNEYFSNCIKSNQVSSFTSLTTASSKDSHSSSFPPGKLQAFGKSFLSLALFTSNIFFSSFIIIAHAVIIGI